MQILVLCYCLALLPVVLLAWRLVVREPRTLMGILAVVGVGVTAGALSLVGSWVTLSTRWGGSMFLVLGLLAWGIFLHLPLTLGLVAHALHRTNRRASLVAGMSGIAIVALGVVAFLVEPQRLELAHYTIPSDQVTRPYRLVLVADIQTDHVGEPERRALEAALREEPDMILFAGDYIHVLDSEDYRPELERLRALFFDVGIATPMESVAVEGNCERAGWERLFDGLGVEALAKTHSVSRGELSITALSFSDGFNTQLSVPPRPGFHVVLSHGPDFALGDVDADLLLAGHTHGGQVQLPWIGPLVTLSRVPRSWASGRTKLPDGGTLIVSRGIGMERGHAPRLRFLCRPEVVVIDIVPASLGPSAVPKSP